jgi:glucokinase
MSEEVALVADIGRHSVRFGLTGGPSGLEPRNVSRFLTSEHPTFTSALVAYLARSGLADARLPSVLAVAGAARGDLINPTGSRWYISLNGVEAVLRAPPRALNECAASALALTLLPARAFQRLHGPVPAPPAPGGCYLAIGLGTGLGVAALVSAGGRLVPVQSEAGHIGFAPCSPEGQRFAEHCRARGLPLEVETLLSAAGLLTAYEALSGGKKLVRPEDVTRAVGRDPAATAAVQLFAEQLGAFAGDLALAFGAWDGVYLTGALARALPVQLAAPDVRRRMEDKPAFRRRLAEVPLALVTRSDLELLGAAAALGNA